MVGTFQVPVFGAIHRWDLSQSFKVHEWLMMKLPPHQFNLWLHTLMRALSMMGPMVSDLDGWHLLIV